MKLKSYGYREEKYHVRKMTLGEFKVGLFRENFDASGFSAFHLVDVGECEVYKFSSLTELMLWEVNDSESIELYELSQVGRTLRAIFKIVEEED